MADQTQRLEIATVKAEIGSDILSRFSNDAVGASPIPTGSGDIQNLKQVIVDIQEEGTEKISFATTIYPTTAAGIAGTTNGAIFLVRSADPDEIYAVYSNTAGVAVDTGKRALSATAIQTAMDVALESANAAEDSADLATARTARFLASVSTPPVIRDDGTPLQIGDRYLSTVNQAEYIYKSAGWAANESHAAIADIRDETDPAKGAELVGYSGGSVKGAIDKLQATHERLIFKKKKILSLPLKHPEWDWVLATYGFRFYPQAFCLDEYSGKLLVFDAGTPTRTVLVYNWPSGTFDRVFFANSGLVSEGAVVKMEGATKYLYLRTTGDKLAKYDITTYPAPRSTIAETVITTTACGLNLMERNGTWTLSDVGSSALGNVRSRGKYIKTNSGLSVVGSVDCGDYLMGIYAGRPGDTDVTKAQGVTDTGYGLVAQMGGQWVSPVAVTNYSQNGLRVFTYDGDLVEEGLLQADKFAALIAAKWGFTPALIESEGIVTATNGDVYSLTVTSNNGTTTVSSTHGMLFLQEFAADGEDFSTAAVSRVGTLQSRGALVTTPAGAVLLDPTTNTVITGIGQLLVAMQKAGIGEWSMYTTGLPLTDTAGLAYPTGCLLTVTMFRSDVFYTTLVGFGTLIRKRIYFDSPSSTWIEGQSYASDGISTFSSTGLAIARTTGGPTLTMSGPVASHRQIIGQTNGTARWRVSLGDSGAESGSDSGSNFAVANYTDAGVFKSAALQISRASGETQVTQLLSSGPVKLGTYTLATLPSAAALPNYLILVSNATGGPKMCLSSGTVWQILNTTTAVS